jgi:hypothetical protein
MYSCSKLLRNWFELLKFVLVALVQELRAIDRNVVGMNRIFDYENFTYLNAFINDDGFILIDLQIWL